jgi:PHD/YefM family antitoxin component YafN of YafNO toxin-antitoxin module
MGRVSSGDFVRNFSTLGDAALNQPLVISRHKRDRLVVVGIDLYRELMAEALAPLENGEAEDLQGHLQRLGTNEP